jgi:hypothetical protein
MNYRYALLASTLIAGTAMAQRATYQPARVDFSPAPAQTDKLPANRETADDERAGGDVVWSEDFANGLAGNNGVGPWTTGGPNGDIWKRTTTGPVGAYTAATARIGAPATFANGFMLFNGDSVNCSWVGNTPTALATFTSYEGSIESPVLDLSATPFVEIQFYQRLRYCCSNPPHYLEVSTDGGTTWPTRILTSEGVAVNQLTATELRKFNLTAAIAADPTNVKIRFRHDADQGTSHYHWQIDDVKIVELYEYDMRMVSSAVTTWDINTAISYDSIRYSLYPYSQLRPIGLNTTILNNGSLDQSDVVVNFTVQRQGGNVVLDQDQNIGTVAAGTTQTVFVNPDFTPPAVEGTYNVTFDVSSANEDNVPTDNGGTGSFGVSQHVYARDNGTIASFEDGSGDGGTLILGNTFYVANSVDLYSVAVALNNGSEVGAVIVGELRNPNEADFPVIATTPEIEITAAMLGGTGSSNFTQLIFDSPVTLDANLDYMVTVQCFGNIRIGVSGTSEAQTSFIYYISPTQGEDWFFTTSTPMVRMNFNPTVGIEAADRSNGAGLGQNVPNPANGTTMIPYELENASTVTLEVRDLSGKLVSVVNEGTRGPGSYRITLPLDQLAEGLYTYTLRTERGSLTKRLSVVR